MPAIWGITTIDFSSASAQQLFQEIENSYHIYKIDDFFSHTEANALLGYGHQVFTPEAEREFLPIRDENVPVIFTADCVLDNRSELLQQLPKLSNDCPDGRLLYEAYLKWQDKVTEHVLGAFAFAAYHTDTKTLHLYTDHMGNRSLFYFNNKEYFAFSTAVVPLANSVHAGPCEKWITGCLSNTSADMMLFEDLTPYEGILQMPAACHLSISATGLHTHIYWGPKFIGKPFPHRNPSDYRQLFVSTLNKCTSSMLRSSASTGCTLSGGLDSCSIASLASLLLSGQELYSYTSVPLKDFIPDREQVSITNEAPRVLALCKMHSNISPHFLSCPNQDAFTELNRLVPLLGYPMKSGHNLTWLDAIYRQASMDGCRLMLKGQYGNSTISWGNALSVFYQLICSGHPLIALKTMKGFGRRYGVPRKKIVQFMLAEWKNNLTPASLNPEDILCSGQLLDKHRISDVFRKLMKNTGGGEMDSRHKRILFIFNTCGQMQLGMFDTAMSLIHGVLIRDPSKDKRVVELCCRLPVECALAGFTERGMIRTCMKGMVPDSILNDLVGRGVQSADYEFRSKRLWEHTSADVIAALQYQPLLHYADCDLLNDLLYRLKTLPAKDLTFHDLRSANVLYSLSIFLGFQPGEDES